MNAAAVVRQAASEILEAHVLRHGWQRSTKTWNFFCACGSWQVTPRVDADLAQAQHRQHLADVFSVAFTQVSREEK